MATVASVPAASVVAAMDARGERGWNAAGTVLRQTWDRGTTWADRYTFSGQSMEGVTPLANGELLVSTTDAQFMRRLYRSAGIADGGTVTMSLVLTGRAPGIKFPTSWSIHADGARVVVGEYGPKMGEPWSGVETVQPGENARYVYLSDDYAMTFRTVFDLNTYLTDNRGQASLNGQHVHGVAWDRYWQRLWVSFGDTTDGIVYSDDMEVWRAAVWQDTLTTDTQVVGIIPMPTRVLFGSDTGVGGVLAIDRSHGKHGGSYPLLTAYDPGGDGKWLAQAVRRTGPGGPAFLGFCAEGAPNPSYVVATQDGVTFTEVWRDTVDQAAGFGTRTVAGPTLTGDLIIGSNDQKVAGSWSQITAPYRPGNRVPNPSAERDLTGWLSGSGTTLSRVVAPLTADGVAYVSGTIAAGTVAFDSRITQDMPLTADDAGQWLAWALLIRGQTFTGRLRQIITFYNASGTSLGQNLAGTQAVPTVALNQPGARFVYAVQVPANATRAELRVLFYSPTLGNPDPGVFHTDNWAGVTAATSTLATSTATTLSAQAPEPATPGLNPVWTPGWFLAPDMRPVRVRGLMMDGAEVAATSVGARVV